ncbi:MAG: CinA family protein [Rhabdochlamydiaceae bacterium]|nr:CinA family protein [Rhabdochlamydiaceae bacterium]
MTRKVGILGIGSFVDKHVQIIEELISLGLCSFSCEMIAEDSALFQETVQKSFREIDVLICLGDKTDFQEEISKFSFLQVLWLPEDWSLCKDLIYKEFSGHSFRDVVLDLHKLLVTRGKTLALAESCTGGYISHLITSEPGSSQYFLGSFITYSNALKKSLLGVSQETLENYGAVSSQTVHEMAEGVLRQTGSDFSIAVSGVAGPEGGTEQNPVGTVWLAIGFKDKSVECQKLQVSGDRQTIIHKASYQVLSVLYYKLIK